MKKPFSITVLALAVLSLILAGCSELEGPSSSGSIAPSGSTGGSISGSRY